MVGREAGGGTEMDGWTRMRDSTFLQVSGFHIPLFWKILPLDVHLVLSLHPLKSLLKCPFVRSLSHHPL